MNREEFGKLIIALRKEFRDENDDILTQAKLAENTNLSEITIGNIERGEKIILESEILLSLAKALRLTSRERKEFFYAAVGLESDRAARERTSSKDVFNDLLYMMGQIQLPAFIVDGFADIIAANAMLEHLLLIPLQMILTAYSAPAGRNMLRVLFAPESNHIKLIGEDNYSEYSTRVLRFIRAISLRYRATSYWQGNIFSGAKQYRLFKKYWYSLPYDDDDHYIDSTLFKYSHPHYGPIMYFYTTVEAVTSHGELYFLTYIPADTKTAGVFGDIYQKYGAKIRKLSDWPGKNSQYE